MMLPRRALLTGFCDLPPLEVVYPEQGLTIVTGKNGKGKSARYIEAVAWAGWGETLRGTPPGNCTVELDTDTLHIRRSYKAPKLTWNYHGSQAVSFETPSKANAALEAELGPFQAWCRSSVFSSADSNLFSAGTDGDRKKLLAKLIGADVFDTAMGLVKETVEDLQEKASAIADEEARVSARILETRHAVEQFAALVGVPPPETDVSELRSRQSELGLLHRQLSGEHSRATSAVNVLQGKLSSFQRSISYVADGCCMTCGQPVPEDVIHEHQEELERLMEEVRAAQAESEETKARIHREVHAVELELSRIQAALQESARYNPEAASRLSALKARGRDLVAQHTRLLSDRRLYDDQLAVMKLVGGVLGVRGVRSLLLSSALAQLQDLANAYLAWLSSEMSLELKAQTETAKGTVQERIEIIVHGKGGGHGYKALSGGERRRVDLVLLLALSSLSRTPRCLFFDEAFDALDEDGVGSAFQLITQLAETKPVVVISHNKALIAPLSRVGSLVVV